MNMTDSKLNESDDDWEAENALAFVGVCTILFVAILVGVICLWRLTHG